MFKPTFLRRRKPKDTFVRKYLEGIPQDVKLVDHLSGADYRHSPSLTTAQNKQNIPYYYTQRIRFINFHLRGNLYHYDRNKNNKNANVTDKFGFSKLSFHHVLYPTSSARPLQVVVVRGGRRTGEIHTTTQEEEIKNKKDSERNHFKMRDPLQVPDEFLFQQHHKNKKKQLVFRPLEKHSPVYQTTHLNENEKKENNPYEYEMHPPSFKIYRAPLSSRERIAPENDNKKNKEKKNSFLFSDRVENRKIKEHKKDDSNRHHTDISFHPLRTAVETILKQKWISFLNHNNNNNDNKMDVSPLSLANESGGLHVFPLYNNNEKTMIPAAEYFSNHNHNLIETIINLSFEKEDKNKNKTTFYLECDIPTELFHNNNNNHLHQMLFPYIHFAVGKRYMNVSIQKLKNNNNNNNIKEIPYEVSNITALTRVVLHRNNNKNNENTATSQQSTKQKEKDENLEKDENNNNNNENYDYVSATADPNNNDHHTPYDPWRLGIAVDPLVPVIARTTGEPYPFLYNEEHHKNNTDNENYCLVHGSTEKEMYLCPQREVLIKLFCPQNLIYQISQFQNKNRLEKMAKLGHGAPQQNENNNHNYEKENNNHNEVLEIRALPGDVVYIPKDFGFQLQRVTQQTFLHANDKTPLPQSKNKNEKIENDENENRNHHHPLGLQSLEVDALLVNYAAYPQLNEKQLQNYISGDYLDLKKIDEFYEKGLDPFRVRYC